MLLVTLVPLGSKWNSVSAGVSAGSPCTVASGARERRPPCPAEAACCRLSVHTPYECLAPASAPRMLGTPLLRAPEAVCTVFSPFRSCQVDVARVTPSRPADPRAP